MSVPSDFLQDPRPEAVPGDVSWRAPCPFLEQREEQAPWALWFWMSDLKPSPAGRGGVPGVHPVCGADGRGQAP